MRGPKFGDRGFRPNSAGNHKLYGSLTILVRIPGTSQSYQASIQCCWAIIGPPAKREMAFRWRAEDGLILMVF